MKVTIKELKALATRAGVVMRYSKTLGIWFVEMPWNDTFYFHGDRDILKSELRYMLLGIIAEREGLL